MVTVEALISSAQVDDDQKLHLLTWTALELDKNKMVIEVTFDDPGQIRLDDSLEVTLDFKVFDSKWAYYYTGSSRESPN